MSKSNSTVLLLGGVAALALLMMSSGASAGNELQEAAELADKQKPKPPQPTQTQPAKPKPKPRPEPVAVATAEQPQVLPPVQSPSVDVVIGPAEVHELPAGYNAAAARAEAPGLVRHIRTRGSNYTRKAVATFQLHAGIPADGIYGPQTASALTYWAGAPAPKPLFKGNVKAYTPPEG